MLLPVFLASGRCVWAGSGGGQHGCCDPKSGDKLHPVALLHSCSWAGGLRGALLGHRDAEGRSWGWQRADVPGGAPMGARTARGPRAIRPAPRRVTFPAWPFWAAGGGLSRPLPLVGSLGDPAAPKRSLAIVSSSQSPVIPQNLAGEATFWVEPGYTRATPGVRIAGGIPGCSPPELLVPKVFSGCSRTPGCRYLSPGGRKERRSGSSACRGAAGGGLENPEDLLTRWVWAGGSLNCA